MARTKTSNVISDFVEAADRLVNTLSTTTPNERGWHGRHRQRIEDDRNRYEAARKALMGDPADE